MYKEKDVLKPKDENRDPLSGAPGAHPAGTAAGAAGGGAAGAAIGAVGGPIGAGIGIVAGAVAGGLAGKAAAEQLDPTAEDAYWRENYAKRPYVTRGEAYDTYAPAYRTGYENRPLYRSQDFDEVENELRADYEKRTGKSGMTWEKVKAAARDAWNRLDDYLPGDSNGDGR